MEQSGLKEPPIFLIAALEKTTRFIGKDNNLLWKLPEDMKRFKFFTTGLGNNAIIMGRKTFESMRSKALPNRFNVVISSTLEVGENTNLAIARSFKEAVWICHTKGVDEIYVIGGERVFKDALPFAKRLVLTLVEDRNISGDVKFPEYGEFNKVVSRDPGSAGNLQYEYVTFEKTAT